MPLYSVGKVIKEARKRLRSLEGDKYSQENVAAGICSVATLSKIENGVQNPSKKVMEALLQKLDLPVGIYNVSATDDEIKRAEIEWKLKSCVAKRDFDIEKLLEEYRSCCASEMGVLEKQFYLYFKAIYAAWGKHVPADEALNLFEEAIKLTVKDFTLESESYRRFYTIEELMILNSIALEEYTISSKKKKALKRMYFLKDYFEKGNMDNEEWTRQYPAILANLSNWEEDEGHYDKELKLAEKGIEICIECNNLRCFDHLLFNKGIALAYLGNEEKAQKIIATALSVMRAENMQEVSNHCNKEVKRLFGYDFSDFLQRII